MGGMPDITLFEFHSHGNVKVGPSRLPGIGSGGDEEFETEPEFEYDDEAESSGPGPVAVLIGLALVVGLAFAVKKLRGGDEDEVVPLEESDDLTATADD